MNSNPFLDIAPEIAGALAENRPVVALESTIISHGMPYPQNVETAHQVEAAVRERGAIPATIAILGGRLKIGLTADEIETLGKAGTAVTKVSRRDIPFVVAGKNHGATTVAATMILAAMAGIRVFATGGIGGVHREAQHTFDISADLQELANTPVAVVCAGAKSILDLGLTREYLETLGVPVIGYRTKMLPAFYTAESDFDVDYTLNTAEDIANVLHTRALLQLDGGTVIANPIPAEFAMPRDTIDNAIEKALCEAQPMALPANQPHRSCFPGFVNLRAETVSQPTSSWC